MTKSIVQPFVRNLLGVLRKDCAAEREDAAVS
jgi:hypothetical protein